MANPPTQGQLQSAFGSAYVPPKPSGAGEVTIIGNPPTVIEDCMSATFNNGQPNAQIVNRWTSYNIERDFFTPADAFTLEIEDDRADQLNNYLKIGMETIFKINHNIVMYGYVDSFAFEYDRSTGKKLVIKGRDILGQIADSHIYPYMGTGGQKQFQFSPTDTFKTAMETIFGEFGLNVVIEDNAGLTFATGFKTGIRAKGKTAKRMSKSYSSNLNHLVKPRIGEKYLAYAIRLAAENGAYIKMLPGSIDTVWIGTPVYARENGSNTPYSIQHLRTGNTNPTIESGKMNVSFKDQPSILVMQGTMGGPVYRKQSFKVVAINELTSFPRTIGLQLSLTNAIYSVQQAISELTTGKISNGQYTTQQVKSLNYGNFTGEVPNSQQAQENFLAWFPPAVVNTSIKVPPSGYLPLPLKQTLFDNIPQTVVGLATQIARPAFLIDVEAHNVDELRFGCAKKMAELQQKFFSLDYVLDGHTQNNIVWYPNLMCKVLDDTFDPNRKVAGTYWVERVNFMRSRHGGSKTTVKLNLPYIFMNELTS